MRPIAGLAALVVALGCHRGGASGAGANARPATDTTVRGVVRTAGAEPSVQVVVRPGDAGQGVGITGTLWREIGSLDGVEISVTGPAVANQPPSPPRAVDVQRYEILAVGGVPAHAGVLSRRADAMWLLGVRDTLELQNPTPPNLANLVGKKIFVAGVIENAKLHVQAFGAIGSR